MTSALPLEARSRLPRIAASRPASSASPMGRRRATGDRPLQAKNWAACVARSLANSCEVLGVTHHELLDYQDAQLEFADFSHTAGRLVERIRRLQPQVVITFGMDGAANTHPDHTMVSALTSAAFHWAAAAKRFPALGQVHAADRLYVLSSSFFLPDRPAPMPIPWNLTLDVRSVMERRHEAFRQHTSQAPLMEQTKSLFEQFGQYEYYALVAARNPQPAAQATDMFEGLC